ncbi:alpha/beta hydrolase [Lentilactobacillus kisonensis]|uniref:alpha/beta hydrolase n=1 Tax=Lentilactobacillus kisonensis TaxID=481722 RepID=UPI00243668BA|nr:alpha/beta hydrolase [Lentilactobacillus kisonensis]
MVTRWDVLRFFWFLTHHQHDIPVKVNRVITIAGPFNDSEIAKNTRDVEDYPIDSTGPQQKTAVYRALAKKVTAMQGELSF